MLTNMLKPDPLLRTGGTGKSKTKTMGGAVFGTCSQLMISDWESDDWNMEKNRSTDLKSDTPHRMGSYT